jgi:hypothetical protein
MTEEQYILKYLYRHYDVRIDGARTVIFNRFSEQYSDVYSDVYYEVLNVFNFCNTYEIVKDWYYRLRRDLARHVYDFLKNCDVILTMVDWKVVDAYGTELTWEQLYRALIMCYDTEAIIRAFYEEWREDKIVEATERTMYSSLLNTEY